MLVLSRKVEQAIVAQINGIEVRISIREVRGNTVSLGLEGPDEVIFVREELLQDQQDEAGK